MSLYVLDTDILTLFRQGDRNVNRQVLAHATDELAATAISVHEVIDGWLGYIRRHPQVDRIARGYAEIAESVLFLAGFSILHYPVAAIARFQHLRGMRLNVGQMDLRIAAITLEHSGILVTRNVRDFQRIPGLTIENWAA